MIQEEYELSTYDRRKLNYNHIALGPLPIIDDYTIRTISSNSPQICIKPLIKKTFTYSK
ncbi:hypothetical protein ACP275_04G113700 [Erythranthe tilingii]